jgi:hypothetical protein
MENLDGVIETILAAMRDLSSTRTTISCTDVSAKRADACVPLPPRRRSGGQGEGGGRLW